MMKKLLLSLLLFAAITAGAQSLNTAKLDSLLTVLDTNGKTMGSLALVKNGRVLYERAIGWSQGAAAPATPATRYRIGSITKSFTTVLVFRQIEKGKLRTDTRLSQFYPQVPNADTITIAHLLQHRSGIYNITDSTYLQWNTRAQSPQQLLDRMVRGGSVFPPGTKSAYSNSNFILLGWILEKITGRSYAQLLRDEIVKPAGLKNTYVFEPKQKAGEALSYVRSGKSWTADTLTDPSIPGGAGNIVSTARDVAAFYDALFNGKLVSAASLAQMRQQKDQYGMGLFMMPFYERKSYGHTGGIDAFASIASYFPEDSLAVAWLSNGQNFPNNEILVGVLKIVFNKPYAIPDFSPVKIQSSDLSAYAGTYSKEGFPMKIEIRVKNGVLEAQATGQGAFPLEASGKDRFRFDAANIELTFDTAKKTMTLLQNGSELVFTRE